MTCVSHTDMLRGIPLPAVAILSAEREHLFVTLNHGIDLVSKLGSWHCLLFSRVHFQWRMVSLFMGAQRIFRRSVLVYLKWQCSVGNNSTYLLSLSKDWSIWVLSLNSDKVSDQFFLMNRYRYYSSNLTNPSHVLTLFYFVITFCLFCISF